MLCSGFREATVRRVFDHVSLCFCDWESADSIQRHAGVCLSSARASFRHEAKLRAIIECARLIAQSGFSNWKACILENPLLQLQRLPYIGPITVLHLAKNLGLDVAKPDRHLVRVSQSCGYRRARDLVEALATVNGEEVKVVDLILWRYMADLNGGCLTPVICEEQSHVIGSITRPTLQLG